MKPKIYNDPTITLPRMNEDTWFEVHQPMLLWMANTDAGRDLLCIPKQYPKIVLFKKNCVHAEIEPGKYMADFRVGAKWANVIRYRWDAFCKMAEKYDDATVMLMNQYGHAYSVSRS